MCVRCFFFKQKTAYEMRISDWSSDVCSSDLVAGGTLGVEGLLGSLVTVAEAGRLEGAGRVGGISNAGVVAPGRGGIGTLTVVGDYAGNGGTLEIEAVLGTDSSATDRLVVNGATSGDTQEIGRAHV